MKDNIRKKYGSILSNIEPTKPINVEQTSKVKPLSLKMVLGEETFNFYNQYLYDFNDGVVKIIQEKTEIKKIDFNLYSEFCNKYIKSIINNEKSSNGRVIVNYLNAISVVMNNDDNERNINYMVAIMYETYYLKNS